MFHRYQVFQVVGVNWILLNPETKKKGERYRPIPVLVTFYKELKTLGNLHTRTLATDENDSLLTQHWRSFQKLPGDT